MKTGPSPNLAALDELRVSFLALASNCKLRGSKCLIISTFYIQSDTVFELTNSVVFCEYLVSFPVRKLPDFNIFFVSLH